jgi:hypothetical protein
LPDFSDDLSGFGEIEIQNANRRTGSGKSLRNSAADAAAAARYDGSLSLQRKI